MLARVRTALLILITLVTELALDASTSFVRVNSEAPIVRLDGATDDVSRLAASTEGDSEGRLAAPSRFASSAAHSAQLAELTAFATFVPVSRLTGARETVAVELALGRPHRPPSA